MLNSYLVTDIMLNAFPDQSHEIQHCYVVGIILPISQITQLKLTEAKQLVNHIGRGRVGIQRQVYLRPALCSQPSAAFPPPCSVKM